MGGGRARKTRDREYPGRAQNEPWPIDSANVSKSRGFSLEGVEDGGNKAQERRLQECNAQVSVGLEQNGQTDSQALFTHQVSGSIATQKPNATDQIL